MNTTKFNAIDIANYIVWRANQDNLHVTHLKLQKLLYYVIAKYLKVNNQLLTEEPICKWQYGPVVKTVYHQFKLYGNDVIKEPSVYLHPDSNYFGDGGEFCIKFADVDSITQMIDEETKIPAIVDEVLDTFRYDSAFDLVRKTHNEPAWKNYESEILQGYDLQYSLNELREANI